MGGAGNNMMNNGAAGQTPLADYQMQLMLLEQQNKKRLLMARQEQDRGGKRRGRQRTGHTPPDGKRNTPKMGNDSPGHDGVLQGMRNSPAPGFDLGQMGQQQFFAQMPGPNGAMRMMQNPQQMQMDMLTRQNGGRLPNGFGGPGVGGPGQQGAQQMPPDANAQRNNMPPPQAPTGGATQRTNPPSPAVTNAAPSDTTAREEDCQGRQERQVEGTAKEGYKGQASASSACAAQEPEQAPNTDAHRRPSRP
ncbi:hypothetical protein MRB53_038097 [Persea americana]|nr:hypothetical protein MRB53_038097 [Persea americana]